MKRLYLSFLASLILAPYLPAQNRKIAFRTLALQIDPAIPYMFFAGKGPNSNQKVTLFTDVSPVIEGGFAVTEARFFMENPGPDGKPVRTLAAKAPLSKSERQLFIFVATGKKDGLPYRLICYDDDIKAFPMGMIRAINMAPVPVRFIIAGQATPQIPPGEFAQFPHTTKVSAYQMYPVVVEFLNGQAGWVKGQSVTWKATERRREIVVTLADADFAQPAVRMYGDFPPWLETAAEIRNP